MHGGINAHRTLVRIFVRDALIHVEQVAVTFRNRLLAKTFDGVCEVEIHTKPARTNATSVITRFLCST